MAWITIGAFTILYTEESRNVVKRMYEEVDRKILAVLPLIFGVLFILSAPVSRHAWFIRLIGITAVGKGLFIFTNPHRLYETITDWYITSLSDQTYRFLGILTLILGTAVLSWIL
ncbi:MAG: hypothetical protein ABIK98_06790 [Pseudomonadota bacterium]